MKQVVFAGLAASIALLCMTVAGGAQTPTQPNAPLPKEAMKPTPPLKPLPPGPLVTCNVDPAIVRIYLNKGRRPNEISIRYDVLNLGRSTWRSGPNQAQATITTKNANTGAVTYTHTRALPTMIDGGRTMLLQTTPTRTDYFDTFEFGGTVEVSIAYDPDILMDANRCNDDANTANNTFSLTADQVLGFMRGTATRQVFNR